MTQPSVTLGLSHLLMATHQYFSFWQVEIKVIAFLKISKYPKNGKMSDGGQKWVILLTMTMSYHLRMKLKV